MVNGLMGVTDCQRVIQLYVDHRCRASPFFLRIHSANPKGKAGALLVVVGADLAFSKRLCT